MQPIVDSKKLLYFATVVELGSLKKAARQLSISQPALSMSMDRLEAGVGRKLLERGPSGVVPTEFGDLLCSHARFIKDELSLLETRLAKKTQGDVQIITLGVLPSLTTNIIPSALSSWQKKYRNVQVRIIDQVQVRLLLGLDRGVFDFIVGQTGYYNVLDGIKQRVLFRDRLRVFARHDHPLFKRRKMSWADLVKYPWVLPMVGGRQRNLLERLVGSLGLEMPKQLIESGSNDLTRRLVAASNNLAMLPDHAIVSESESRILRALPISDPALNRDIVVVFRERAPPNATARDLLAHIRAVGRKFSGEI